MSLYNNVEASLITKNVASGGLLGVLNSISSNGGALNAMTKGLDSVLGSAAKSVTGALGGGALINKVAGIGTGAIKAEVNNLVNQKLSTKTQRLINVGTGTISDLMQGDWNGAGVRLLDSGIIDEMLPGSAAALLSQARLWGTPAPLFGGITATQAKQMYDDMQGISLARKNLWLVEVTSNVWFGLLDVANFNMFVTDLEYSPFIISGNKIGVGSSKVDLVEGSDAVELRMTTLDDKVGTLKRWFANCCDAVASQDGTVGVPDDYAVKIKVLHSFISDDSNQGGYQDIGLFRPVNLDLSLSRRENGLEELQMTFSQLDTFMTP